jgi:hypothetical protein
MNNASSSKLRGLGLALLTLAVATAAHADLTSRARSAPGRNRPADFTVSGVVSGVLNGQVIIDGVAYPVGESPQVFQIGAGMIKLSELPIGSRVYATGATVGQSGLLRMLIVRPADEKADASAPTAKILVRDPATIPR